MNSTKRTVAFIFAFALLLSLAGCIPEWKLRNFPLDFVGSTWRTEGGEMEFTVDENHYALGTIFTDEGKTEAWFSLSVHGTADIYPIEWFYIDPDDESRYEIKALETWWIGDYTPNQFKAVVEATTYFKPNQVFIFHRVDDGDLIANEK